MGKKEQIEQLTVENAALNDLLRQIGDIVGVSVPNNTTINTTNIVSYTSKFTAALASNHPIERSAGAPGLSGGGMHTFDDDIDDEIDRANAAVTDGQETALVQRRQASADQGDAIGDVITSIGRELGLHDIHLLMEDGALRQILARIRTLKGGGGDVAESKGDSLSDAIQHNSSMRVHLDAELTRARKIIGLVAGALQIAQWDADGTELIEKVQRWEAFKHMLSRRIRELRTKPHIAGTGAECAVVADELEMHLAGLMGSKQFAKWLESKPRGTVSPAIMEAASDPPPVDGFETTDVIDLTLAVERAAGGDAPANRVSKVLLTTCKDLRFSATATNELARLMNVVILPLLARQKAARG